MTQPPRPPISVAALEGTARVRLEGVDAVRTALDAGRALSVLILPREPPNGDLERLRARAQAAGAQIWLASAGDLRRMSRDSARPAQALAVIGPAPDAPLGEAMAGGGVTWLMHRAAYPSNVGFTIRTAEVSGADAVVVDAPDFNHRDRSRASHVSMGADRLLPVLFESTEQALHEARRLGHRIVAVEDVGTRAPWQTDLTGPLLLIVGNERTGIDPTVLEACHDVVRIPMTGFVPSYNLQAAVAAIAYERLRQLQLRV